MKRIVLVFLLAVPGTPLLRAEPPGTPLPKEVEAILHKRCGECHGEKAAKAQLTLTTPAGLARGGRKGIVVRPRKPDESRLWQMVRANEMPPDSPLPPTEREALRQWIEAGASGLPANDPRTHWAFQPPRRPALPAVKQPGVRNAIDHFIAAALEDKKLTLAPEAEPATLLRRVALDLTGLPPTPAEIDAFRADSSAEAYARMVDRYLASPRYGERWGKHWLDTAGYADSNGYFNADSDRPLAYKYRDWVIRSCNADMPFDRFVRAQLAGDELAAYAPGGDVTPETAELLVATHFLRNAPDGSGESDGNPDEVRTDRLTVLEGNLQNTMSALLGLTIQCARCHAHKFEPIDHEEYYRLQAIFAPVYSLDRWVKPNDRTVPVGARKQREEHQRRTERVDGQVRALQAGLATLAGPYREMLVEERLTSLAAPLREEVLLAVRSPKEKLTAGQQQLLKMHVEPLKISDDDAAKRFPEYAAVREQVRKAVAARERERPAPLEKLAVAVEVGPQPPVHHLLLRGQHNQPGKEVQPGVVAALTTPGNAYAIAGAPPHGTGRRTAFARWVTAPANPLFARVYVNRVWQNHFGKALVATPDNFGLSGARPSHAELLDWLALEFIDKGYSVKHLHRLILNSAAYRQASATTAQARALDPDNRLLSRFPLQRLDAETLRDAMLAVSGELDAHAGGPYVPTLRTPEGNVEVDESRADARRRSVYLQQRRTQVATFLELFDAPAITSTCSVRNTSTVPIQALTLLNSDFARRRARAFAERLRREVGPETDRRILLAFRLAYGRPPRDEERTAAARFLEKQRKIYLDGDAEAKAWTDCCQMLLASNAFLYVE
jgi:Protein of unknown function (DUF1553)/Protein of unknown function (DUF1549)/Planctomycete cytochrome C